MSSQSEWRQSSSIILSKKQLGELVPYCTQQILRLEKKGKFPKRIPIGPRRVGWRLSDIEDWIAARAADPSLPPPSKKIPSERK